MLYERWSRVVCERRNDFALREVVSGRSWTFGELLTACEKFPAPPGPIAYPQGHSAEFILHVLAGWRAGQAVCPLEKDQVPPNITHTPPQCAHLKTTSATGGKPRLVAFTAGQLMADPDNLVATMGLRPDWPNLAGISMAHSYGFSNLVLPLLLNGIPLIIAPSPLPEMLRQAAADEPALTLPGVPALWRAWHEADALPANVRLAISAGAPLPLALEREIFGARGLKIHNFYGSSECGGIAYDRAPDPREQDAYVGMPVENVRLTVNQAGCMEVRSDAVGQTYWPEAEDALGGGCFRTADLAEIKDGRVYLRGRAGDLINVAGRKVAPEVIEQAIRKHPDVRECLVLGIPSPEKDRTDWILAVVTGDQRSGPEGLRNFLLEKLPAWQVPREWWWVDSISADARGKLSRAAWREQYLARPR